MIYTLATNDLSTGTVAGQIIASIAAIEIPQNQWTEVMRNLLDKITTATTEGTKISTLQTIGFVCEQITPEYLERESNAILTAVAQCARKEEPNPQVRLAAVQALHNSLDFVRENFEREGERNYIMQIVCEATQSTEGDLQVAAFECLVKIMANYYEKMLPYMQKALMGVIAYIFCYIQIICEADFCLFFCLQLTVLGMRHDNEKVVLQAIEFWSTVAETECDIQYEQQEAYEAKEVYDGVNHSFALTAMVQIVPFLLWLMTKQEEDGDEDEWNVSMAAATCLSLFAACTGSAIVGHVLPFVEQNIKHQEWNNREAAVMAFGSILDGPEQSQLGPLVEMALPTLIELMSDSNLQVKDTTAWALSRICEILMPYVKPEIFPNLLTRVINGLNDNPRVAANCAWCIINLAEQLAPTADQPNDTSTLSPYFEKLLTCLNETGEKSSQDPHLRASVYEAMSTLVNHSPNDCIPLVQSLLTALLGRLKETVNAQNQIVGSDERRAHFEFQANICSVLTSCIRRLDKTIAPVADEIMGTLLMVISTASKVSTVMEDAFLVIGALAGCMEGQFIRYMDPFLPFLGNALQNHEEHQLCVIAIGLVGDICRALNEQIIPYCDNIMTILGTLLGQSNAHRNIKPACLAVVGDMSLAIGAKFETYLNPVMLAITALTTELSGLPVATNEQFDFKCQMEESIAEAYVGIVQGLKTGDKANLLLPYVQSIFAFLQQSTMNLERPEPVTRSIVGLVGDLAEVFPPGSMKPMFTADWISSLLREVKTDRKISVATKEVGKWARELVRRQIA